MESCTDATLPSTECTTCASYLRQFHDHVVSSHTKLRDETIKEWLEQWFRARFQVVEEGDTSDAEEITNGRLIKREINPFLAYLGLKPWSHRTPLFKDWFATEILGLDAMTKSVRLKRLMSRQEAREHLREQLSSDDNSDVNE